MKKIGNISFIKKISATLAVLAIEALCVLAGCEKTAEGETKHYGYQFYDISSIDDLQNVFCMGQTEDKLLVFGENSDNTFYTYSSSDTGVTWSESKLELDVTTGVVYAAAFDMDGKVVAGCVEKDDVGNTTNCYIWKETDNSKVALDALEIKKMCIGADGSLYVYDGETIGKYSEDGDSAYKSLYNIEASNCLDLCTYENEIYVLTESKLLRYDSETGKKNDEGQTWEDDIANGIKASEENSGLGALSSHRMIHTDDTGDVILLLGNGIYKYELEDGLITCLLNAQSDGWLDIDDMNDFVIDGSEDNASLLSVCLLKNTIHIVGYSTQEMTVGIDEIQAGDAEQTELRVYTLEEWDDFEVSLWTEAFEKKYPNITITYECGIPAGSGITAADAVKALNTQLLADEGPDVIFMDGLDVQKYADAGLLLDLSDTYEEILEENPSCLTNVMSAYKTEQGVYAIPARLRSTSIIAPEDAIDSLTDISSITEYIKEEGEPTEGNNLNLYGWKQLFEMLYPVYASDIVSMDEVYSEDNLRIFLNDLKELNDLLLSRSTEEEIQEAQQEYSDYPSISFLTTCSVEWLYFREEGGHNMALASLSMSGDLSRIYSLKDFGSSDEELHQNDDLRTKILSNESGNCQDSCQ